MASLTCRNSGSVLVAALQQDDEGPGADAAHADHLAGHVDDLEALQQVAAVLLQGGPVGPELLVDHVLELVGRVAVHGLQVAGGDDHRWLAHDPVAAVDHLAELRQGLQAVAGVRLLGVLAGELLALLGLCGFLLVPRSARPERADGLHDLLLGAGGRTRSPCCPSRRSRPWPPGRPPPRPGSRPGRRPGLKPLLRAAMVKLAAMRLTSYSNGPGRVSSKSFRSNSRARSGEANTPKFDRWASPHSCTFRPAVGVSFKSVAMILAAPR